MRAMRTQKRCLPKVNDRVAFYGSLMSGFETMRSLGLEAMLRHEGPCICAGDLYDLGDYPGLRSGAGRVAGELYEVLDIKVFERLDEFEGFDAERPRESLYLREYARLLEPTDSEAWIYIYNHIPARDCRIPSGNWREHLVMRPAKRA